MNLSTEQSKIDIKIEYEHEWVDHPLDLTIKIDQRVLHIDLSGQKKVSINKKISIDGNSHIMSMHVTNKNNKSVVLDEKNNIVHDSYIKVKKLVIDGIDLTDLQYMNAEFTNVNGDSKKITGGIYHNGSWRFHFSTPLYVWLLEKMF